MLNFYIFQNYIYKNNYIQSFNTYTLLYCKTFPLLALRRSLEG